MDPLTHALSGYALGKSLSSNKTLVLIFVIFSLLPDIDILLRLDSKELFLTHHRGITHGVLALLLLPLIAVIIFIKKLNPFKVYLAGFLGYLSHIVLDLTNQYGTKIFSPLDWNAYSLSLTFIVDPYVLLPLLFGVSLSLKFKKKERLILILSILFVLAYIGSKAYLRNEAREFLKQVIEAQQYRLYPLPNDFLQWWFVVRFHDEYTTGMVDLFSRRVYIDKKYKIKNDTYVVKSKEASTVKALISFGKHPVSEVKKEGETVLVIWRELSYGFLPNDRFSAKVWLRETKEGLKIINTELNL